MSELEHEYTSEDGKHYEVRDTRIRPIMWFGVGLAGLIVVAFVIISLLFGLFTEQQKEKLADPPPLLQTGQLPPGPRLQVAPELDMYELRAIEDSLLHRAGWIARERGIARIPVDSAMTLMLQRGFSVRPDHNQWQERQEEFLNGRLRPPDITGPPPQGNR